MMQAGDTNHTSTNSAPKNLSDRVRSLRLNDRDSAPPRRGNLLPWGLSFILLLTTTAFGYRAYRGGDPPATAGPDKAVTTARSADGEVVLQAKGYVIPISLVQVSPKVGGQLVWINDDFREGAKFKAGDKLAQIEDVDYKAEYEQALFGHKAFTERYNEILKTQPEEIKMAEAELDEARQMTTQLRLDYERNKRLMVGSATAQRDMEMARYTYESNAARVKRLESSLRMIRDARREARLQAAKYDMQQAKGVLDKAEWRLKNTSIIAPISGTILTKKAELGNIVNPSAFASGISASLCEMANLRELEIDLSIQERDVAVVKTGMPCLVMPEAYQNDKEFLQLHPKGYHGTVSRLMPTADRAKGAVPVRVLINSKDIPEAEEGRFLRPDMGALVSFMRLGEPLQGAKSGDGKK
jgi:HlyD family secretion protein